MQYLWHIAINHIWLRKIKEQTYNFSSWYMPCFQKLAFQPPANIKRCEQLQLLSTRIDSGASWPLRSSGDLLCFSAQVRFCWKVSSFCLKTLSKVQTSANQIIETSLFPKWDQYLHWHYTPLQITYSRWSYINSQCTLEFVTTLEKLYIPPYDMNYMQYQKCI